MENEHSQGTLLERTIKVLNRYNKITFIIAIGNAQLSETKKIKVRNRYNKIKFAHGYWKYTIKRNKEDT